LFGYHYSISEALSRFGEGIVRERDFEIRLPFSLREKGLGDEGGKFAKVGCTRVISRFAHLSMQRV